LNDIKHLSEPAGLLERADPELLAIDSLVEQVRSGDERAFTRLVARMQPLVRRWVVSYVSSADEADDVVQETFVIALRRLGQYRGGGSFNPWLYRIASRAAGRMRAKARNRAVLAAGAKAWPDRIVYETDPGGRVDRERLSALVREFWEDLPERQRTVVDLVDLQGYSPAEAATMLDLNASTLRANLFKGRQSLRSRLLARHPSLGAGRMDV
jgi:RNA polymerase sigma-70 factor, ECF subfamily